MSVRREAISLPQALAEAEVRLSRRIAQQLHDDLCQRILGITIAAKMLGRDLQKTDDARSEKMNEIVRMLEGTVESCRDLMQKLNTPAR